MSKSLDRKVPGAPLMISRASVVLAAASYLGTALALSRLDPRTENFIVQGVFWLLWTVIGFGEGWFNPRRAVPGARGTARMMVCLAVVLAVIPGLSLFKYEQWGAATLLLLAGARAPNLKTPRDLSLCLLVCVVCACPATTSEHVDSQLLFFVVTAWVLAGLAITAEYTTVQPMRALFRLGGSAVLLVGTAVLAWLLFHALPRPPQLGWGFQPPEVKLRKATVLPAVLDGIAEPVDAPPKAEPPVEHEAPPSIPPAGDSPMPSMPEPSLRLHYGWITIFVSAVGLAWWCRRAWSFLLMSLGARALARLHPARSIRLTARALRWRLRWAGHRDEPQLTLREHLASAGGLDEDARRAFAMAVEIYGETRFGAASPNASHAIAMVSAVIAGSQALATRDARYGA